MECFDQWDSVPGPAGDTELHLLAWFLGIGLVFTLAKLLRYIPLLIEIPRFAGSNLLDQALSKWNSVQQGLDEGLEPMGSPPSTTPLRI
jgi:hypothetical protein